MTTNEKEVAGAINQTVAAERELQLNALAKDQAMSDADAGNYRNAAESLRANAKELEAVAANAPMPVKQNLELKAQEQRARADEIDASGMSKSLRKKDLLSSGEVVASRATTSNFSRGVARREQN